MDDDDERPTPTVDKGKGRATSPATERTPLLGSSSAVTLDEPPTPARARRRLLSRLLRVFLISLSVCLIILLLFSALAWSYAARVAHMSPEDLMARALVMRGPDRLTVLNITQEGGIWLNVEGRVGLDVGEVLEINSPEDDNDAIWSYLWKSWGRWGVKRLDSITTNLTTIHLYSDWHPDTVLASVDTQPLQVPLTTNPPRDLSWLTDVSMPIYILPTQNVTALAHFARHSWREGTIAVRAVVDQAIVLGGTKGWRRIIRAARSDVRTIVRKKLPPLPGLPTPGHNTPFPTISDLITLQSFTLTSANSTLAITAVATLVDPAPASLSFTAPALPFVVSLPANDTAIPVAAVHSAPFSLTHPNITLHLAGHVLALPPSAFTALSVFLARYLGGAPNPVQVHCPLLPAYAFDTLFPAPDPPPRILRDVTIRDMKIKPDANGAFLASGSVHATVVLPRGMEVDVHVDRVLPDVLIYDGPVPTDVPEPARTDPPPPPLPSPLPERAFGHIRPEDWLDAISVQIPPPDAEQDGTAVAVSAKIVDVPLEVLPGREREFSDFVGKVVFGRDGAVAGLQGVVAVSVRVQGLPTVEGAGEMQLAGLPFQGSVHVGKKSI